MDNRRPELTKRQKEIARQKKQQEKIDRRNQRHRQREERGASGLPGLEEDDPDIAGIVPGPQPQDLGEADLGEVASADERDRRPRS